MTPGRARLASLTVAALALTAAVGSASGTPGAVAAPTGGGDPAVTQRLALQAGLQTGPKHTTRPQVRIGGRSYPAADPFLAQLRDDTSVDWSYWRRRMAGAGERRARARTARPSAQRRVAVPASYTYQEREPAGRRGRNDTRSSAEQLTGFGLHQAHQAVDVDGRLSLPVIRTRAIRTHEDQGSIPRATRTGIGVTRHGVTRHGVTVSSRIGDGPHGRARDRHGDFDFFRVHAAAGEAIRADTRGSRVDTVLVVYGRGGGLLDANDDLGESTSASALSYTVPRAGDYFVMVGGYGDYGTVPADPFRSGSGSRAGDEGRYRLRIRVGPVDRDCYAVHLDSGDVLGGTLTGAAHQVAVRRTDGTRVVASQQDASSAYPAQSPLPGGGATFAYVAEEPGWYAVSAEQGNGAYRLRLESYRPGSERAAHGAVQTIFLDFDGERLNTAMFGGYGVSTLSPLRRYLPRWGLHAADQDAVVDAAVASFKQDVEQTLRARGLNHRLAVRVLDSRDDADPFGRPDVSRVVVGGSIRQTGVATIGIAQSVDPGNYAHEETAMVLLDSVSEPRGPAYSLNTYLGRRSDRAAFVGRVLGDLAAHETGHLIGSFHTDELDATANLMDAGGGGQARFYGVGPDRLGGTADDRAVDFGEDRFTPQDGFAGLEDTLNNSAWALSPGA